VVCSVGVLDGGSDVDRSTVGVADPLHAVEKNMKQIIKTLYNVRIGILLTFLSIFHLIGVCRLSMNGVSYDYILPDFLDTPALLTEKNCSDELLEQFPFEFIED